MGSADRPKIVISDALVSVLLGLFAWAACYKAGYNICGVSLGLSVAILALVIFRIWK